MASGHGRERCRAHGRCVGRKRGIDRVVVQTQGPGVVRALEEGVALALAGTALGMLAVVAHGRQLVHVVHTDGLGCGTGTGIFVTIVSRFGAVLRPGAERGGVACCALQTHDIDQ